MHLIDVINYGLLTVQFLSTIITLMNEKIFVHIIDVINFGLLTVQFLSTIITLINETIREMNRFDMVPGKMSIT